MKVLFVAFGGVVASPWMLFLLVFLQSSAGFSSSSIHHHAIERSAARTIQQPSPSPSSSICHLGKGNDKWWSKNHHHHHISSLLTQLEMAPSPSPPTTTTTATTMGTTTTTVITVFFLTVISFVYWYLLVFGAAVHANGWPIPNFLPLVPSWPPTTEELQPVLEDSFHFFYLSELLQNQDAPYVIPPRLAIFNIVEAWIFAYLPALWKDPYRLPRPILFSGWLILGINLTNAFLAPYLLLTEIVPLIPDNKERDDTTIVIVDEASAELRKKNHVISFLFGGITSAVVGYAVYQCLTVSTAADWTEFGRLVQTDRTYLAFCIDPILLSIFQPLVLGRIRSSSSTISSSVSLQEMAQQQQQQQQPVLLDYIPLVGLITWLFSVEQEEEMGEGEY